MLGRRYAGGSRSVELKGSPEDDEKEIKERSGDIGAKELTFPPSIRASDMTSS